MDPTVHFKTKTNVAFPGVNRQSRDTMLRLIGELGVGSEQIVEAASYSMAMVVRYALGLSATGGKVCAIAGNALAGAVATATLRHLVNAGAEGIVLLLSPETELKSELQHQLAPLKKMGVTVQYCDGTAADSVTAAIIQSSHNVIGGFFDGFETTQFAQPLVNLLNECQTPIHVIEAPPGVDVDTGARTNPLFASSTLSLGAPFIGLAASFECVGRHYLCDISSTALIYKESGSANLTSLFSEQPVLQISPA